MTASKIKQFIQRIKNWHTRRSRARKLRKIERLHRKVSPLGDVREFIYLNETSLKSIYVSRYGPEDAKISLSHTVKSENNANLGLRNAPASSVTPAINGGISKTKGAEESRQIEFVASSQSLFRDLLDREEAAANDSVIWNGLNCSEIESHSLLRGKLILVKVRLRAHPLYNLVDLISAFASLNESVSAFDQSIDTKLIAFSGLFKQILGDHVAIKSEIIDWGWNPDSNKISNDIGSRKPVSLVALMQLDNFWIAPRQVLFNDFECTLLARIKVAPPVHEWSPVTLFDSMKGFDAFKSFDFSFDQVIAESFNKPRSLHYPQTNNIDILKQYAELLLDNFSTSFDRQTLDDIYSHYEGNLSTTSKGSFQNSEEIINAFHKIDKIILSEMNYNEVSDKIGELRTQVLKNTQHFTDCFLDDSISEIERTEPEKEFLIPAEVIAIYW